MSLTFASSTVLDSILFRDAFGTQAMRDVFSDHKLIARYIEVEVALAKAEARCGVIPQEAADTIARESRLDRIDFEHMRHETDIVGYPILPLVHQLVAMCGDAGRLCCTNPVGDVMTPTQDVAMPQQPRPQWSDIPTA